MVKSSSRNAPGACKIDICICDQKINPTKFPNDCDKETEDGEQTSYSRLSEQIDGRPTPGRLPIATA